MTYNIKNNFIKNIIKKDLLKYPEKKINTRFPPEPNGYLHLGHAKSIFLNFNLAKMYNGTCNLRFDDTNPKKENIKYIKSIKKDIKWLGYNWNKKIRFSSDYFQDFYKYAIILIKKKLAYVDQLNKLQIKELRGTLLKKGINSPYRNQTIQENLSLFEKMKNGFFKEGQVCLRAKIDMNSSSLIMRDPVLYRILYKSHHQTKKKWCIYPTYDFSHCISDALEGITYSLCTLEFLENKKLYNWILKKLSFKKNVPQQYEFSRLNLEYTVLSKRKLQLLLNKKIIKSWDDPRMPTISGFRKKGYTANSINNFCEKIGFTKQESMIQLSLLDSCIRKDLNISSYRKMAILQPILIFITNYSKNTSQYLKILNHPHNIKFGYRYLSFSQTIYIEKKDFKKKCLDQKKKLKKNIKIKLRYSYVITIYKIVLDKKKNILFLLAQYDPKTLGKKNIKNNVNFIIHWISQKDSIPAIFKFYSPLFLKKKPEKSKNILNIINPKNYFKKKGYIEKSILKIPLKTSIQFERIGYFFLKKINFKKNLITCNEIISLKKK
ncbi:glutamine--tRNA ligase [Buchnera aphidicola]|uniref:Glutamine--tRNA ligase n=1 Tax=Buchnera aphidicola subsp. Tuberolachnus salignus TaxID=98804 RepID=A0A170PC57_BUCTT|nr:glutamine--tRNA ligase [Buchnera aphidicola]CUR53249.1 Glutamine--tRNA ligase [Buchnera aphidicola (Tuberolachnus salignus)]